MSEPLQPLTVKAARKLAKAKRLGAIPTQHVVATSLPGATPLIATGGPALGDTSLWEVKLYGASGREGDVPRVALSVAAAGLEMGYRSAVIEPGKGLPKAVEYKPFRGAGWSERVGTEGLVWTISVPVRKGDMRPVPVAQGKANRWIDELHSHLDPSRGSMFSVGVVDNEGALHCVAQVGVIRARMLMAKSGGKGAEVVRVASDRTKNVATMALGACVRSLQALGYTRIVSYTMLGESGVSYASAGWRPTYLTEGGDWGRPSRARKKAQQGHRKVRWEIGPAGAYLGKEEERELRTTVADAVGKVEFDHRDKSAATDTGRPLMERLSSLRVPLAAAAQRVYDDWKQDDDGLCDDYGAGGICDDVASAMSDVIGRLKGVSVIDGGQDGDDHAFLIALTATEAVAVDIPPGVYEKGGGYCWRKKLGVVIGPDDVVLDKLRRSDFDERVDNPSARGRRASRGPGLRRVANPSPELRLLAPHRYPQPVEYTTDWGSFVRDVAHKLKVADPAAVRHAAGAMAPLLRGRAAILVPIPSSKGDTSVNLELANAIAALSSARVENRLTCAPHESQYVRHHAGKGRLTPDQISMRCRGARPDGLIVLVDNVADTGATLEAARRAVGGDVVGLVWAAGPSERRAWNE